MKNQEPNNASRRDFVINSSIVAGGLIATPFLSRANYFSGAEDTIKVAVIGCGTRKIIWPIKSGDSWFSAKAI